MNFNNYFQYLFNYWFCLITTEGKKKIHFIQIPKTFINDNICFICTTQLNKIFIINYYMLSKK